MSILAAATWMEMSEGRFILISTLLVAAMVAFAAWKGTFTERALAGPVRMPDGQLPSTLWLSVIVTFFVWFGASSLLVTAITLNRQVSTTSTAVTAPASTEASTDGSTEATTSTNEHLTPVQTILIGMTGASCAFIACLVTSRMQSKGLLSKLGLHPRKIPIGIVCGGIGSLVAVPLTIWSSNVSTFLTRSFRQPVKPHELLQLLNADPTRLLHVLGAVSAVCVTPLLEETLFRGHIQTALVTQLRSRWGGVLVASAMFALVHTVGWMTAPLFLLSICFGYAYERTGNLWAAITMHAVFNGVSLMMQA